MITIGVDCRKISDGGIGTYLRNIIEQWYSLGLDARFILFCMPDDIGIFDYPETFAKVIIHSFPKYSASELFSFRRHLIETKAHVFFTPHYTLPYNLPCPSVVTIHDLIHLKFRPRYGFLGKAYAKKIIGHAVKKCRTLLTDSEHSRKDIISYFPRAADKTIVVNPAVNRDIFKICHRDEINSFRSDNNLPEKYIFYAGALKTHKNPQALVTIINKLEIPLVVASQDEEIFNIRLLPSVSDTTRIILKKSVSEYELAMLYNCAELLVFPSLYEGFGLPPLEAMACGLPVVCSDRTSLPEVCGDAALMFSPDNIPDMLDKINLCLNDSSKRTSLRNKGLKRAEKFNWDDSAKKIFELIRGAAVK
jgi:glycosyltransferase involved in cell wall biosynthesis